MLGIFSCPLLQPKLDLALATVQCWLRWSGPQSSVTMVVPCGCSSVMQVEALGSRSSSVGLTGFALLSVWFWQAGNLLGQNRLGKFCLSMSNIDKLVVGSPKEVGRGWWPPGRCTGRPTRQTRIWGYRDDPVEEPQSHQEYRTCVTSMPDRVVALSVSAAQPVLSLPDTSYHLSAADRVVQTHESHYSSVCAMHASSRDVCGLVSCHQRTI